jgi:hypothetical protein
MKEKHFPGEKHTENVYEKNIEGKQVLVLVVPKDKNGYYCMGSDMEMRVIHRNISTYKPYLGMIMKLITKVRNAIIHGRA